MGLDILTRTPELLVMEQSYDGSEPGPPPHYHPSQDEHFEVLEGAIAARIGAEEHVFGGLPGGRRTSAAMPRTPAETARRAPDSADAPSAAARGSAGESSGAAGRSATRA